MSTEQNNVEMINLSKVYESLRFSEYSVENGIGELVDNGVEAGAHNLRVDISSEKQKIDGRKKETEIVTAICVADDGIGMEKSVLQRSLVLGDSMRVPVNGKRGIGRFGVGLTLGSISLGRRVEVYSRNQLNERFNYTYIDLSEISESNMKRIPEPVEKDLPSEYEEFYKGKTGTLIVITNCDRVVEDAQTVKASIANYLGRTYRKFIEGGLNMSFNGEHVYLHDPLYLAGPTKFDFKDEGPDPKATLIDSTSISLPIPGTDGETADVKITLSLLPSEWRKKKGDGGSVENKKRKVDQNEGVSILRANREVLYDKVPYLIGKKGQARYMDLDRFWGCEISFPPELDSYFQVRYIKRGVEPIGSLKDQLKLTITDAVSELRKRIQSEWDKNEFDEGKKVGDYAKVEAAVDKAENDHTMKGIIRGKNLTEEQENSIIDSILKSLSSEKTTEDEKKQERQERKESIKNKQMTLAPVNYPASILFEPEFLLGGKMVIKINVNHPFYQNFIIPLCGNLEDEDAVISNEKRAIRDAIFLLFCSYARASAMHDEPDVQTILEGHLSDMGTFLKVLTNEYCEGLRNDQAESNIIHS